MDYTVRVLYPTIEDVLSLDLGMTTEFSEYSQYNLSNLNNENRNTITVSWEVFDDYENVPYIGTDILKIGERTIYDAGMDGTRFSTDP